MKAELVPENGDAPIPITRDVTVIGRREFCDVRIEDASLSKRHAVVIRTDGLLVIRDLATTNGTKVKGQRIRWAALLPDDRIALGGYKMKVYLGPDDVPGPSERGVRVGQSSAPGFPTPTPSPPEIPVAAAADGLEILEDDDDDASDSGWRKLIARRVDARGVDDDVVIDLD